MKLSIWIQAFPDSVLKSGVSNDAAWWYRWNTSATPTGEVIYGQPQPTENPEFIEWILSQPIYESSWYEIRGGAFGEDWVKVDDIIKTEAL